MAKKQDLTKEHTLIVYMGEGVDLHLIPNDNITPEQLELLLQAEGKLINSDDCNDGMQFLSNALATKKEYCCEGDSKQYCVFKGYKVTGDELSKGGILITRVINSGFLP